MLRNLTCLTSHLNLPWKNKMAASVSRLIQIVKNCNFTASYRKIVLVQDKEEMSSSIWNTMYTMIMTMKMLKQSHKRRKNCVPEMLTSLSQKKRSPKCKQTNTLH